MSKTCLVADNNLLCLEFYDDVLTSMGFDVIRVMDGLDALNVAKERHIDLFILDFVMPKIDGIRLSRYLRTIDRYIDTPIVLVTAAAMESAHFPERELIDFIVAKGPFERMKDIFSGLIPNIESLKEDREQAVLGVEDIYPRQIVSELLKSELNYAAIFRTLDEGVVELDDNDIAIFANEAFCRLMGRQEHEVVSRTVSELFDFRNESELREAFEQVSKEQTSGRQSYVCEINGKSVEISFYRMSKKEGGYSGSFVILHDITGLRRKTQGISALFNITQAFMSSLEPRSIVEYVIQELRRFINASTIYFLPSSDGPFHGENVSATDRKLNDLNRKKMARWMAKIEEWKRDGLISNDAVSKLKKIRFDNMPMLWLPLFLGEHSIGVLLGFKIEGLDFGDDDVKFFECVGNHLSLYLANAEFHNLAEGSRREAERVRREVATLAKVGREEIFDKNRQLLWDEKNKKAAMQELIEEVGRSLAVLEGVIKLVDRERARGANPDFDSICGNMASAFGRVSQLREDLAEMNKIISDGDMDLHVFTLDQLMRKITESTKDFDLVLSGSVPVLQRFGDFNRLCLLVRMILRQILFKGGQKIQVDFNACNKKINMIISFSLEGSNRNEAATEMVSALLSGEWSPVDDGLFYFFWKLKGAMNVMNGDALFSADNEICALTLEFPSYSEKGERYEEV